jgi:hypothetical protein
LKPQTSKNPPLKALSDKWHQQFKNSYETKHYLIVTTKEKTLMSKTLAKHQVSDVDKLEGLENKIIELMGQLHDYSLELLQSNDLISYWASLLNGRAVKVDVGNYLFDDYITSFSLKKRTILFFIIMSNKPTVRSYPLKPFPETPPADSFLICKNLILNLMCINIITLRTYQPPLD